MLKGECGRERAEVCEKLVSEVNKSICHNQFRCKIPSLLGQISLFLFQREGEQKKKAVERRRKFSQFDYEICLGESYGNRVARQARDVLKIEWTTPSIMPVHSRVSKSSECTQLSSTQKYLAVFIVLTPL